MKFNEKIAAMVANGKLTTEQAAVLAKSLGTPSTTTPMPAYHAPLAASKMIGLAIGVAVMALIIAGMHGTPADSNTIQQVSETLNQSGKVGEMNKSLSTIISIVVIGLPALIWFVWGYNSLVTKEEDVLASWAQVETNYQRRADLIPNLVKVVKAYADHEGATLTDIAKVRSQIDAVEEGNVKVKTMAEGAATHLGDDAYMASLAKAQQGLSGQVKNLMVAVESYPTLRSSDQFMALQAELEGTENRINVARMDFNEHVGEFNASIRHLPGNLIAGIGSFQRKAYFKSDEGADKVVNVDINTPAQK